MFGFRKILELLLKILRNQEMIMAQLGDLNNEVGEVVADEAQIKTDIGNVLAELIALQGTSSPDLSGAIAKLMALHTALAADDATLQAAETPAAPAPPATTPSTPPTPSIA
jgi:hypothetical protein